jgi:hypothetical protein
LACRIKTREDRVTYKPSPQPTTSRSALTEELIARKATDLARWEDGANLATQWDGRAKLAAELIGSEARRVLDLGAGAMTLRSFLPAACDYVPADVARRSDDCLVIDLNQQQFPAGAFDVVTFLGVLEYIHDPAWPLRMAAGAAAGLVVSYCTEVSGDTAYRRGLGWVNDFTKDQFEALLRQAGWRIEACGLYKQNAANAQYLWKCARAAAPQASVHGGATPGLGGLEDLPQKDFVVISPYPVDPRTSKKPNMGDGFILNSALKLIGARPTEVFSSRLPISASDLERINASRLVLVAGANTLKSAFEITPNFTPELLARIRTPVALFGIGHYGVAEATAQPLDPPSEAVVREILRRFPYVSARCDASARYLGDSIPDLADRVLMTSCPVVHDVDGLHGGFARKDVYDQLVCTVTDRGAMAAQAAILQVAPRLFPARRRILALHQDYGNKPLWDLAQSLGYEVFRGDRHEDFLDLYHGTDIHLGNRVHAHLKCLSQGVRSFLTPFDLRQAYFAESLDFPLITRAPDAVFETYDFRRVEARIAAARPQMDTFVEAIRSVLDGH